MRSKDLTFSQVIIKDFAKIFQNFYCEKYTFQWHLPEFMVIFRQIVIFFLVRNTPNNKFLDVTNKETKSCGYFVEIICYELGVINLYFEGVAISA